MIFIKINNKIFFVKKNISILEACKYVGITIPRFCYHESLSISGNCRMCLVEIEPNANLKPVSACTLTISEDMHILTDTPFVKKARENVLETLLLHHPLDCPICDQGGECDLQDQTKMYGLKNSRYFFNKRGVEDKFLGSLIKSIMTRCIHCTRCVRFSDEFVGKRFLGTLNRGQHTEIGPYVSTVFDSNISGNVIDLCPVGALTSKIYAFKARPWELKTTDTIDLTDSVGANIYVATKETEIVRVLPKKDNTLNNAFISDKARFSFDAAHTLRVNNLFVKKNSWEKINWASLLINLKAQFAKNNNTFLIPEDLDYQSLATLVSLKHLAGSKLNIRSADVSTKTTNFYSNNLFSRLNSLDTKPFNTCFLFSSNLKLENVVLNMKIRMLYLKQELHVYSSGFCSSTNFLTNFVTLNSKTILQVFAAKHYLFSSQFITSTNVLFVFGQSFNTRFLKSDITFFLKKIVPTSQILTLNKSANTESTLFWNIRPINTNLIKKSNSLFNINLEDNLFINKTFSTFKKNSIYWLNSHSSSIVNNTNYIIPTFAAFEIDGVFINFEGRAQKAYKSILNLNRDVVSLNFIFDFFKKVLNKTNSSPKILSVFNYFIEMSQGFVAIDSNKLNVAAFTSASSQLVSKYPFKPSFEDFYQTNNFTKNSVNMFKRSKEIRAISTNFFK